MFGLNNFEMNTYLSRACYILLVSTVTSIQYTYTQGLGLIALKYALMYDSNNLNICTKNEKKALIKKRIYFI